MSGDHEELFPDLDAAGALRAAFRGRAPASVGSRGAQASRTTPTVPQGRCDYEPQGEIARGGMGVVLKALDRELDRDVALKVLRDELALEPRYVHRFLEEARVTARLDHPGIVPVHEVGRDAAGRAYFAMRLVRGRDLKEIIELANAGREGWSQARCLSVFQKVCEAMAYAHDKGVLHRDLKPSNVMVGELGEVYVMDWGLARVVGNADAHDLRLRGHADAPDRSSDRSPAGPKDADSPVVTMDGEVLGTPCYMSPEQAQGRIAELGPRSDVYSVGAMLYHLLANEMPYVRAGTSVGSRAVLLALAKGPPRPLASRPGLSAELIAICERAMARDPAERYPSMLAMAEDLRAFLENRVVQAHQTGAYAEFRKWVVRNKGFAAASAAAVLALVAGLVASLILRAQSKHNADVATARADDVLRLSALQELDDLTAEANGLWPPVPAMVARYEAWMARARRQLDELPAHEAKRTELRKRAVPWTAEQVAQARARHPRLPELEASRRRVDYTRAFFAAHAPAAGGAPSGEPAARSAIDADPASLPERAIEVNELAWDLVKPSRTEFGGEAKGLALARKAAERVETLPPKDRASIRDTLAWALYANGFFDEALAAERLAQTDVEPERAARFQQHLDDLEALVADMVGPERAQRQRARIAELEQRVAELEAEVSDRPEWIFADTQDRWWHNQLTKLIAGMEALADPERGHLAPRGVTREHGWGVGKRLEFARTIEAASVTGPDAGPRWAEAIESIRDECPQYGGLVLAPQLGLLPIGRDPASGLWEFAHLQSGVPAERGPDGDLVLREEMGLVLVLLPGGTFQMGAQARDPSGPNFDPEAFDVDGPVHPVTLAPFFLSKYEMTQGQWLTLTGSNPSHYSPEYYTGKWSASGAEDVLLHPVEQVNWLACAETLARAGLVLPSEARWEYGCRGGTSTVYWCGDDPHCLQGVANLADVYGKTHGNAAWAVWETWLDDGQTAHARVGQYRANAFGLHDVHGNVLEWCKDWFEGYGRGVLGDDGEQIVAREHRVLRGGHYGCLANEARSAVRQDVVPEDGGANLGVRPARSLDPR